MSQGKKILEFKGNTYAFEELIDRYCDEIYDEKFQEGMVKNIERDYEFPIENLLKIYIELSEDLIGGMSHLNSAQKSRIKSSINSKITSLRIKELEKFLEEGDITKEQLEELFILQDRRDIKKEFEDNRKSIKENIIINNFIKVNQDIKLPRELSIQDVGRFYRLLELVVNKNKIYNKPHGNSKEMKLKDVMEYIECSKSTFKIFIKKMEDNSVIRRYMPTSKRWVLFINPIYAHKELYISNELFNVFKDVLEERLDKKVLKYLELIFRDSDYGGSLSVLDE